MYYFKSTLNKKQKEKVIDIILNIEDVYKDFYLTINNQRLFIRENLELLFKKLRKGDKIAYGNYGLLIVTGISDKAKRKYIKILANDKEAKNLLKFLAWNFNKELFIKVKKNNPLINILLKSGFFQIGNRGKEVLLKRNKWELKHEHNINNKRKNS